MFIDHTKIYVRSGNGAKGCRSFYRDKYTRQGIPDGGNGGCGADIIVKTDRNLGTLLDFKYNRHFYGSGGRLGSSKGKKGKDASALFIRVPCGTTIKNAKTGYALRDLDKEGQELLVCRGGKGGYGNRHNRQVTAGEPGEEKELILDLKLIADVGLVGFPNAGKSTLITHISRAHSKIAAYPFTTKFPVLGVVNLKEGVSFVVADMPGLIEGASGGRGLGDKFLRHIERTKVIVHLIDMSAQEGRDPVEDYRIINKELRDYNNAVYKKPQIIAASKMDLENSLLNLERFKKAIKKKVYPISALKKDGLEELIEAISRKL